MKKGQKATILLDSIDLDILLTLKQKPRAIMELKGILDLEHKNVKNHLTKLIKMNLIQTQNVPKSRKIILSLPKSKEITTLLKILKK